MESFDQSLKYLLQHETADFIRFGLDDPSAEVLGPLPSALPSRGREVDGGYLVQRRGDKIVVHLEFHRRNEGLEPLAIDVAEAQIRLYRRERLPVLTQVWDLYGRADEPVLSRRALVFGATAEERSQCVYQRVNLRGMGWAELLAHGPPGLWPLVPLTRDGAHAESVRRAREAIVAREPLGPTEKADLLAVLWFIAEAEDVPTRAMRAYLTEEQLMGSELYESIIAKGEARGEARGTTAARAETVVRLLTYRMGAIPASVSERVSTMTDAATLSAWYDEALLMPDAEAARRLVEKIEKAPTG